MSLEAVIPSSTYGIFEKISHKDIYKLFIDE